LFEISALTRGQRYATVSRFTARHSSRESLSRLALSLIILTFAVCLAPAQESDVTSQLDAARKAEAAGHLAEAESIYSALVRSHPDANVYQRLGLVRHLQNKFSEAADAFTKAVQLNPQLWPSHLFLGMDLYRMSQFPDALEHLQTADRLQPNQSEIRFWLAATNLALHNYLPGLQMLEDVLKTNSAKTEVLKLLAESYADYGTQLLNQVAEKYPDSAAGLEVQGRAFEFEGSYDAALQAYRKAAAKDPARLGISDSIARVSALAQQSAAQQPSANQP
jgi:tetratricopeptide (TPR) repeat protein